MYNQVLEEQNEMDELMEEVDSMYQFLRQYGVKLTMDDQLQLDVKDACTPRTLTLPFHTHQPGVVLHWLHLVGNREALWKCHSAHLLVGLLESSHC
eukprot:6293268-Amphidinium_carterae.1